MADPAGESAAGTSHNPEGVVEEGVVEEGVIEEGVVAKGGAEKGGAEESVVGSPGRAISRESRGPDASPHAMNPAPKKRTPLKPRKPCLMPLPLDAGAQRTLSSWGGTSAQGKVGLRSDGFKRAQAPESNSTKKAVIAST